MAFIKVLVPGPWWHELTYDSDADCGAGIRVLVPMGRGERVGLCVGAEGEPSPARTRRICAVIDKEPVLPGDYIRSARVVASAFLCSTADVLRTLLPSSFWRGEPFPIYRSKSQNDTSGTTEFYYRYSDAERFQFYREQILETVTGALILFPEREQARQFHKSLIGILPKERIILWPVSNASATMRAWKSALSAERPVIIGGPGAAAAPLKTNSLIVVEEEASLSWRSKSPPVFSLRSFAAARSRELGGRLVLGGRIPSSRVFSGFSPEETERGQENAVVRMIDMKAASRLQYQGMQFPLPLSDALISDTVHHVGAGSIVFWLLDRRGVSGEIHCADCGQPIICARCGAPCVIEKGILRCPLCGNKSSAPDFCPSCGGRILEGSSPGLELLRTTAEHLLNGRPVVMWHGDDPANQTEARERLTILKKEGGLVLGSRRALTLLDSLSPALLAWLDADAEARRPSYMSRFYAYSMLLESCWRGGAPRDVLLQTRRFSQPWVRGLLAGWRYFWNVELKERSSLGFPPVSHLVEIETPSGWGSGCEEFLYQLDEAGFFTLRPGKGRKISVFTPHMAALRHFLECYFTISRSRFGFPRLEVWSD